MPRTTAIGYYHQNLIGLAQRVTDHLDRHRKCPRERMWKVRAAAVVLAQVHSKSRWSSTATTAPASCWPAPPRTYLHRYGVKVGNRPAIVTA